MLVFMGNNYLNLAVHGGAYLKLSYIHLFKGASFLPIWWSVKYFMAY